MRHGLGCLRRRRGFRHDLTLCRLGHGLQRLGQAGDAVVVGEERPQGLSQLGMFIQERLAKAGK